jgi:N-acyl-D-aspartate/D-glutamate deacylase
MALQGRRRLFHNARHENKGRKMTSLPEARRPLASRSTRWAGLISRAAVRSGLSADGISILSLVFAVAGAAALLTVATPWNLLAGAACVQLRLLCNLIDGMVAIEGGR